MVSHYKTVQSLQNLVPLFVVEITHQSPDVYTKSLTRSLRTHKSLKLFDKLIS